MTHKMFHSRSLGLAVVSASLLLFNTAQGQEPTNPTDAAERAQLENYIGIMKLEAERSQLKADALKSQLGALDADIESRMDRIITLLSSVRDSTEGPGSRMRKEKQDAIDGLKASVKYYAQERDRRRKEMESPNSRIEDEELARDIAALNARIELRVTQTLSLAESLVQAQENPGETAEQRKARYDAQASVTIKSKLMDDLKASIEKQTRDIAAREQELKLATDPQKREQLKQANDTAREVIAARRKQIEELIYAQKTSTRAVSGKAAFELENLINDMTAELRRDFAKFKSLVYERDEARARVKSLQGRMAYMTDLLAKPEPLPAAVANDEKNEQH